MWSHNQKFLQWPPPEKALRGHWNKPQSKTRWHPVSMLSAFQRDHNALRHWKWVQAAEDDWGTLLEKPFQKTEVKYRELHQLLPITTANNIKEGVPQHIWPPNQNNGRLGSSNGTQKLSRNICSTARFAAVRTQHSHTHPTEHITAPGLEENNSIFRAFLKINAKLATCIHLAHDTRKNSWKHATQQDQLQTKIGKQNFKQIRNFPEQMSF